MEKGFFHPERGYWQTNSDVPKHILDTYPKDTKEVSICPGDGYTFNGNKWVAPTKAWLHEKSSKMIRGERDLKLRVEVDPILSNTFRFNEMSPELQDKWLSYRKSLLDITDQSTFPDTVVWPNKPS
jgi:hypothetical protein